MTTENSVGAVPDVKRPSAPGAATDWHSIDWRKVYRNVRRLQARIVKAASRVP